MEYPMDLTEYKSKRNFKRTPEPVEGKRDTASKRIFVVHRHAASTLHYDLRLEVNGALKSWAIPEGPSMNPDDKRLAILVEDHPLSYASFTGTIPEGNYGAGVVTIWDKGSYGPNLISTPNPTDKQIVKQINNGVFKFTLNGRRLKGTFSLVRMRERSWLLIKGNDRYAVEYKYNSEHYTVSMLPTSKLLNSVPQFNLSTGALQRTEVTLDSHINRNGHGRRKNSNSTRS